MLRERIEKRRKLNRLKKESFNARKKLIVATDEQNAPDVIGCIKLVYSVECCVVDGWRANVNPEDTYRVIGPHTRYCVGFNSKNPLASRCCQTSCPMYEKYKNYIKAYEELHAMQNKTK